MRGDCRESIRGGRGDGSYAFVFRAGNDNECVYEHVTLLYIEFFFCLEFFWGWEG